MKNTRKTTICAVMILALAAIACGSPSITTTTINTAPAELPTNLPPSGKIDLQVGSYNSYRDSIDSLWFVGLVVNNGTTSAESVEVAISLLDSDGNVAAVGSDILSYIPAGGKFPFKILVDGAPNEWKDVKIQIQGTASDAQSISIFPPYIDLTTQNITGKPSGYGTYSLAGMVSNTGQQTATLVHVVAAAYDTGGAVIDVGDTFTALSDIPPGGDSPFELDFSNIAEAPANYEVFVVSFSQ